ncbi:MAG: DUF2254 domain-containing protein, partial [Lentisphaeraceae bacterium]|nr:DUF2254 domain-containing protein [Lentisphaeraceae bacterium]
MIKRSILWIKNNYQKVIDSIAFYPVFIAFLFLIGSTLLISFDFSEMGMKLKGHFKWLNLEDASTVRSIVSAIAGGVISLTVFSFSMVMVVLNQAASQMSNRVLDKLIGNRFQQVVLGVYIGTIVYAFFLLSMVSDFKDQNDIPSLSTFA